MDNKPAREILAARLIELREERGLTQQELADKLNITRQSLSLYERAERTINIDLLLEISKVFDVSADYLLGVSGNKTTDDNIQNICKYTGISEETVRKISKEYDSNLRNVLDFIVEGDGLYFLLNSLLIYSKTCYNIELLKILFEGDPEQFKDFAHNFCIERDIAELHAIKHTNTILDILKQAATDEAQKNTIEECEEWWEKVHHNGYPF